MERERLINEISGVITSESVLRLLGEVKGGAVQPVYSIREKTVAENKKVYVVLKSSVKLLCEKRFEEADAEEQARAYKEKAEELEVTEKQVITDKELRDYEELYGEESVTGLKAGMGAEAIQELLQAIDLEKRAAKRAK